MADPSTTFVRAGRGGALRPAALATVVVGVSLLVAVQAPVPVAAGTSKGKALNYQWGTTQGRGKLRADLRWPTGPGAPRPPFPLVVLVHGGGFVTGDEDTLTGVAERLTSLGYATMTTEYTLHRPDERTDTAYTERALGDLRAAIDFAVGFRQMHADLNRVGMLGASSGAVLCLAMATRDPRLKAVVSWSGIAGRSASWGSVDPPAPVFAANSVRDQRTPFVGILPVAVAWKSARAPFDLYVTAFKAHGTAFWTLPDPLHPAEPYQARVRTIEWLDRYVKGVRSEVLTPLPRARIPLPRAVRRIA
ncbi:MAG: dienelactone hydrolase family protein [Actinomycetota bacterium]